MANISDILKKYYRTSFIEMETVVVLMNFIKHKKEPEKVLDACLYYRTLKPSSNRRGIVERQYDLSRETVYRICNECESLKL